MRIQISNIRYTIINLTLSVAIAMIYVYREKNYYEVLTRKDNGTETCEGVYHRLKLVSITDLVCVYNIPKWIVRMATIIAFPYAVLITPYLANKSFYRNSNYNEISNWSNKTQKILSRLYGFLQACAFSAGTICIFILDYPQIRSDVDLEFQRKQNFSSFYRTGPTKSNWSYHILLYCGMVLCTSFSNISYFILMSNFSGKPNRITKFKSKHFHLRKCFILILSILCGFGSILINFTLPKTSCISDIFALLEYGFAITGHLSVFEVGEYFKDNYLKFDVDITKDSISEYEEVSIIKIKADSGYSL